MVNTLPHRGELAGLCARMDREEWHETGVGLVLKRIPFVVVVVDKDYFRETNASVWRKNLYTLTN
ncbi:hypothetical protein AMJ87_05760 [candidate division WOR_3 bacterium SM23_60]|uniref:Uncharacterized protein n=1 Tax=candidate division WOR_3 bacterium SM23_60 TaxID=1703780 RepID=A0A0S8GGA8_UNCW3|nr:MAG: hypothetical protein AMJ87_05760 [candidate division WOR_3 bacterium SM23_60]